MIPSFPVDGGWLLVAGRAVSVAGLMAGFGGTLYRTWLAPAGLAALTRRRLDTVAMASLLTAGAGAMLWLALQTADFAGAVTPDTIGVVLAHTQFGHLVAARFASLAAAAALLHRWPRAAAGLAGLALLLQAGHSHALAMHGADWLLASAGLHLLASGAWLGSLIPLLVVCQDEPASMVQRAALRFSPFGMVCVACLAGTTVVQALSWIGDLPGLIGTAYGWVACCKMLLFAGLIALAVANRRVAGGVSKASSPFLKKRTKKLLFPLLRPSDVVFDASGTLARGIAVETCVGLATIAAASLLSELPPAMHVQKLWPLPWTLSLAALIEDPDYRLEAAGAALAVLAALALLATTILWARRFRWPAAAAALVLICLAGPHFVPMMVPAVATEYFRSPTGYSAAGIAAGELLYSAKCAACHGKEGHGDGPASFGRAVPPADLTAQHLFMHSDGQLYWWITRGIAAPDGSLTMPGSPALSDDQVWALIDFIRARNLGFALRGDGKAAQIAAPDFSVVCAGRWTSLSSLRGQTVRLEFATGTLFRIGEPQPPCAFEPRQTARAYAIAVGLQGTFAGEVLLDADGWLRFAWNQAPSQDQVTAAAAFVMAHPLDAQVGSMKM